MTAEKASTEIQIAFEGQEQQQPLLLDVASFLYDVNLLYEIARLGSDEAYSGYDFSRFTWFRNGRPLRDSDRLRVVRLRQESPILLVASVTVASGALAAISNFLESLERVRNWRLNRALQEAQLEKLKREAEPRRLPWEEGFLEQMDRRGASPYLQRAINRLDEGAVRIERIEVTTSEVDDTKVESEEPASTKERSMKSREPL